MTEIQRSYPERNQIVLEYLRDSNDPRYGSILRYLECQDKYQNALSRGSDLKEAAAAASDHWNTWAINIKKLQVVTVTPSTDSTQKPDDLTVDFGDVTFGSTAELTKGSKRLS